MFRNLKNIEWSKRILLFVEVLILLVVCIVLVSVLMGDTSAIENLITAVFSLASLSFGFYYWKAKNENIRKFAKSIDEKDLKKIDLCYKAIFGEDNHV